MSPTPALARLVFSPLIPSVLIAGLALLAPQAAQAATINVSIANLSDGNSRDTNTGVLPNGVHDFRTDAALTGSTATTFDTRYTAGLYGEAQNGVVTDLDLSKNLGFRVTINVTTALALEEWELSLDAIANGGLADKADSSAGCCDSGNPRDGWVNATDLSVLSSGATATYNDISNPGTGGNWNPLGSANNGGSAAASFGSGADSAVFIGTGNATITLDFTWSVSLNSDSSTLRDGNEMGYMFGQDDGDLSGSVTGSFNPGYNTNAGGIWNRDQSADGYFVSGTIITTVVPEPSTALLLGMGLMGLATRRRG